MCCHLIFLSINYFGEVWMAMTALSISRKSCKNSWTCIWACNSCPPHFTKPPDVPDWSPCQADFGPPESYALHSHLYYFVWNCTSFRYNQSQDWICSAYAPWLWSSSSPHPLNQPRSRHLLHRPAPLNRTVNTHKLKPLQVIHFLHNYTPHSPVSLCCWEGELLMLCSAGWFLLRGNNSSC